MVRRIVALGAVALAIAPMLACPPNEAVLCGSRTENALAGCKAYYDLCKGNHYRLDCASVPSAGVRCTCIEDEVTKKTFDSADACNVTPDTLKKRAAAGCGWDLGLDGTTTN